jgi:hypothetical protein
MPAEPTRRPRKLAPYARKPGPKGKQTKDSPATSAKTVATETHENLTLHDWMTVFAFIDAHPALGQTAVVEHFKSKAVGALVFTQSTLSRKLKDRTKLEARVQSYPNALSSKRPRMETSRVLRRFRAQLSQIEFRSAKQTTLTSLWGRRSYRLGNPMSRF